MLALTRRILHLRRAWSMTSQQSSTFAVPTRRARASAVAPSALREVELPPAEPASWVADFPTPCPRAVILNERSSSLVAGLVLAAAVVPVSLFAAMREPFKETAAASKACHNAFTQ